MKQTKTVLRLLSVTALTVLLSAPALARDETQPTALAMTGDALIARPLGLVITAVGTGVFLVTLPFSALGGNVINAADTLVVGPGKETFWRCLGCRASGRYVDPNRRSD